MSSLRRFTTAPTLAELEAIAEKAAAGIPAELRQHVRNVLIRVEDFPDEETAQEMELESPFDLLGLYRGVGMPWQSVTQPRLEPDLIFLYRRPILDYWCETGEDLTHLVRHVLIHEIGHHFGFSDADMEALEAAADPDQHG
ncbi:MULTISPECIES: metallopeptidase family protein [Azospirillaceae]|uniref:metallopeptidase family protein n=1 Tax=Azospirillaceae TaxID=2829815 RepID=UPI000B635A81|nr:MULTISPECIES: metallopeptidase family protein [Azospirillaceae]MDG5497183.1 metallopeptidase family protein [Niveispirillum sp. BGYR6]SNS58069.1 Predicted Zn-dependent protease, minimal metalloprotease (MMP)-like domain [Azospirillum sp. RU38E]SNS77893.1 Predicted Zn-dependent protease, minimal metalloprotease (MMP)-like domain [Azospirillum sp. RU37A]